ncbi:MAG: hypothetical protein KAV82_03030, partial [Phycisphaerae bacterium]|nr:hypothetical protein [Phycisphaerae bacterium]
FIDSPFSGGGREHLTQFHPYATGFFDDLFASSTGGTPVPPTLDLGLWTLDLGLVVHPLLIADS